MREGRFENSELVWSSEDAERLRANKEHDKKHKATLELNNAREAQRRRDDSQKMKLIGAKKKGGPGIGS